MKRRMYKLVLFVLLGAILNVAVAFLLTQRPIERWFGKEMLGGGASLLVIPPHEEVLLVTTFPGHGWLTVDTAYWLTQVTDDFVNAYAPEMSVSSFDAHRYNSRDSLTAEHYSQWSALNSETHHHLDRRGTRVAQSAFGWPQYSLKFEVLAVADDGPRRQLRGGIAIKDEPSSLWKSNIESAEALPLQPLWPGFAINTAFYAASLSGAWLICAFPFALRRRRRIKRGLCPACAYPIGDSAVCTECGRAVAR